MSLLLAFLACKSTPTPAIADGPALAITGVPDPLAPCGNATIDVQLGGSADAVQTIAWEMGEAFGSSPLDRTGPNRSFVLPLDAIADSCSLPTCQFPLVVTLELPGGITHTTETDVVVLTDVDPEITLSGESPDDYPDDLYVTDEVFEAELELLATAPERLFVSGAACIEGLPAHDCIRVPMTYDGGGDWIVDAAELTSCRAGQLKETWDVQLEIGIEHCAAPLSIHPAGIRFLEEDCDDDGLVARTTADGDCDDLDPDPTASAGGFIYADLDLDGFGDATDPGFFLCPQDPVPIEPFAGSTDDCDDTDPLFNPDAPDDQCDGLDQNCGAGPDDEAPTVITFPDDDGDGWGFNDGLFSDIASVCDLPVPDWGPESDCDEFDALVNPGVDENPATPYDDNCDVSAACGFDCDTEMELLFATGTGLVAVTDALAFPPVIEPVRSWTETPVALDFADLQDDGWLDAILVFDDSVVVEHDLGQVGSSEVLQADGNGALVVGDFDQDGIQDVLVGSDDLARVYWGGATLTPTVLGPGNLVARGDFDSDGCDDLVVVDTELAGTFDTTSAVHFGTPDLAGGCERTFVEATFATQGPAELAVGDLDGVGGPELAIAFEASGDATNPSAATQSRIVEFNGRTPVEFSIGVTGATTTAISSDGRVAFGHVENGLGEGISVYLDTAGSYTLDAIFQGSGEADLLWYPLDDGVGPDDLVTLTAEPGGFDQLFYDGDPALQVFLGFDIPSSEARVVPFESGFGYDMVLFVGRHPDGTGLDNTRYYIVNQAVSVDEFSIAETAAFAPYVAFGPSHFPAEHPAQDLPQ